MKSVQYKFKFYSNAVTQNDFDAIFKMNYINQEDYQMIYSKYGVNIQICQNLIKLLKGEIEEAKIDKDLKKASISFIINFEKGNSKCNNQVLVKYSHDAAVLSWPPSIAPTRTNLSITKIRNLIKSKNVFSSHETRAISNENIEWKYKSYEEKCILSVFDKQNFFVSSNIPEGFRGKLKELFDNIVVGNINNCNPEDFLALFINENDAIDYKNVLVIIINGKTGIKENITIENLKKELDGFSEYFCC